MKNAQVTTNQPGKHAQTSFGIPKCKAAQNRILRREKDHFGDKDRAFFSGRHAKKALFQGTIKKDGIFDILKGG